MKKVFSFLIVLAMMLCLTACNADDGKISSNNGTQGDNGGVVSGVISDVESGLGITSDTSRDSGSDSMTNGAGGGNSDTGSTMVEATTDTVGTQR